DAPARFRGLVEGVGLRLALIVDALRTRAPNVERAVASGGAIEALPPWHQLLADMLALPVVQSLEGQATLRGTALAALEVLAPDRGRAAADTGRTYEPNPEHAEPYRRARLRQ